MHFKLFGATHLIVDTNLVPEVFIFFFLLKISRVLIGKIQAPSKKLKKSFIRGSKNIFKGRPILLTEFQNDVELINWLLINLIISTSLKRVIDQIVKRENVGKSFHRKPFFHKILFWKKYIQYKLYQTPILIVCEYILVLILNKFIGSQFYI